MRKAPATADLLTVIVRSLPAGPAGLRDRALLLVGFASALRRSELVALQVADVALHPEVMLLQIRSSKTDQEGRGAQIAVPRGRANCPAAALEAWLKAADISDGPIFREVDRHGRVGAQQLTDRSVARIVKRSTRAAGFDERDFSGHSLRAGFVTTALERGVDTLKVMAMTRHAKVDTLRIYDRRRRDFANAAGKDLL